MFKALKQQLILIGLSTVMAGFSLASIVIFTDPQNSNLLVLGFFYVSLFLATLGILTFLGLGIRSFSDSGLYMPKLILSFRQAALISLLLTISLFLQSQSLLYWWVELSLVLLLAAIEGFLNLKI